MTSKRKTSFARLNVSSFRWFLVFCELLLWKNFLFYQICFPYLWDAPITSILYYIIMWFYELVYIQWWSIPVVNLVGHGVWSSQCNTEFDLKLSQWEFWIHACQRYWSVIFFSVVSLPRFGIGDVCFVKWIRKCALLLHVLQDYENNWWYLLDIW